MVGWTLLLAAGVVEDGLRLSSEGKWAEARVNFTEALRLEPNNALAWKALGVTAGKLSDAVEAEDAFRRGCQLNRRLADVCYYDARALYII